MENNILYFKNPGAKEWQPLSTKEEATSEEKMAANNAKQALSDALLNSLQMQNIAVLAGSGTSLGPVNGPSMWKLWQSAIGDPPTEEATRVAEKIKYKLDGPSQYNIEEFLSNADAFLQINNDSNVKEFVRHCRKTILQECSTFLEAANLDGHITFLHRLSRRRARDPRLKIFTTNYDLCFEIASSAIGGVVIDGFSFSSPRHYDPRYFSYDIIKRTGASDEQSNYLEGVIKLYKLHGSVNWSRTDTGTITESDSPSADNACLIYPAKGKYQQSYLQPHLELISQYLSTLREPNTCLIIAGFGFNDDHLSEPIISAIKSNPHLRLIIADPLIKARETEGAKSNKYWKLFEELRSEGFDIWLINSAFQGFAKLIPDLKALTPADKLMKVIKDVAGGKA